MTQLRIDFWLFLAFSGNFWLFCFQKIAFDQDSIFYAAIFLLRMWLLEEEDPAKFKRLEFLMDGDTTDLQDKNSFSMEIAKIMQTDMNLPNVEHSVIIRLMGIKRTNASTLLTG